MFKFISDIFQSKSRQEANYEKFANLIREVKKISSVYECGLAMKAVIKFRDEIPEDDLLHPMIGNLVAFIIDTRHHAQDGYHKSTKTNWKTSQCFPDINDYFKFKNKIQQFP